MANEKMSKEERKLAELIVERITKAVELINLASRNAEELVAKYGWDVGSDIFNEAAARISEEALGVVGAIADEDEWNHNRTKWRPS